MGQMCWLAQYESDGTKILHLRLKPEQPWKPYTAFPGLAVKDYPMPGGSKGWATYQKLFKANWELVSSSETHTTDKEVS